MQKAIEKLKELANDYTQMADHLESRLIALEVEDKLAALPAVVPNRITQTVKTYRYHAECLTVAALLLEYNIKVTK